MKRLLPILKASLLTQSFGFFVLKLHVLLSGGVLILSEIDLAKTGLKARDGRHSQPCYGLKSTISMV